MSERKVPLRVAPASASRRALMPVLASLGVLSVITCASWFRTMEVSAPHVQIHRIPASMRHKLDQPEQPLERPLDRPRAERDEVVHAAPSAALPTTAAGTDRPADLAPTDAAAAASTAAKCVHSKIVPTITDCLLRPLAISNIVINSVADEKYALYAINYVKALRAANITNFAMGSLDTKLLATFQRLRAPCFSLANITQGSQWHATNRFKIRVVLAFIELGVGILFTDIDVMFMVDPMPFVSRWPQADQLVSSDLQFVPRRSGSGELEDVGQFVIQHAAPLNVGIMLVRPSPANLAFIEDWLRRSEREMGVSMQAIYDILMRTNHTCTLDRASELATCYKPPLKVGLLPIDRFLNGYAYFIAHLPEERKVAPIAIHGTFQVHQAMVAKIHRFREARLFFDDEAYYSLNRRFLSYTPEVPRWLLQWKGSPSSPKLQMPLHFEAVHFQLGQLRWALALALALNRTLILPRFTCLLDNSWYPMMGAWPGFRFTGPFHCPADHVLNFEKMRDEFGVSLFREHSFFDNVRTHPSAKGPPRVVFLAQPSDQGVPSVSALHGHPSLPAPELPALTLPGNATSAQARAALGSSQDAVLHFPRMVEAFSAFSDPLEQERFEKSMKRVTTLWCCIDMFTARELKQRFPPGHIYYDPFWDRPHKDRFGRTYGQNWTFKVGERDLPTS